MEISHNLAEGLYYSSPAVQYVAKTAKACQKSDDDVCVYISNCQQPQSLEVAFGSLDF